MYKTNITKAHIKLDSKIHAFLTHNLVKQVFRVSLTVFEMTASTIVKLTIAIQRQHDISTMSQTPYLHFAIFAIPLTRGISLSDQI